MMHRVEFKPTADNMYVIAYAEAGGNVGDDFKQLIDKARACEQRGEVEAACNQRFEVVKQLIDLLPDEDEVVLDWEHTENQMLLTLIRLSAIDHFLVGDFEMAAGMLEMLLDMDPEDHLEATKVLAYCYIALEEYELFDEVINDVSDKYPEKDILKLWSDFRRTGELPAGELIHFKKSFPAYYSEFVADEHEITVQYITDIEREQPTKETQARELWLQTEHLWLQFPTFIEALKSR